VPGQQALVEQGGIPIGEGAEVGAVRIGLHVVGDEFHPGPGDRVVVFLRGTLVRGDALDPVADSRRRLGHAVPAHGQEGQVDVLPVPELPAGPGDLEQERGQFVAGPVVRHQVVRHQVMRHQQASCKAATTAW
jgi:hypothetical protein